jgi:tripartite-type tricarboxylate transporter receptor subunit TctC
MLHIDITIAILGEELGKGPFSRSEMPDDDAIGSCPRRYAGREEEMPMNQLVRILASAATVSLGLTATAASAATCPANFPTKPVRFVVGYGPGGGTDTIARSLASVIEKQQGWTVIVENMPGAGGANSAVWLKNQTPDGYVLGVNGSDAIALNPALNDVGYTWEDFDYIGSGMQTWVGLAALVDKPFDDIAGLVEYAKEHGRATISVAGVNQEIIIKEIAEEFGVNLVSIPGAGAAEAMTSALGGHVDATTQGTLHIEQIKAGKMKLIASIIDRRVPYAPDVGTLEEQGSKAHPLVSHTVVIAPKGLSSEVGTCLREALDEAVKSAEYKVTMDTFDNEALNLGEEGNRELIKELYAYYKAALAK